MAPVESVYGWMCVCVFRNVCVCLQKAAQRVVCVYVDGCVCLWRVSVVLCCVWMCVCSVPSIPLSMSPCRLRAQSTFCCWPSILHSHSAFTFHKLTKATSSSAGQANQIKKNRRRGADKRNVGRSISQ